jgi:acetylornithine/N-succinyldiaminopimelate aminotransferase
MLSNRQLFLQHLAPTSTTPLLLEIERAKGVVLYGKDGEQWFDLISGISVSNVGHCHPNVVAAVCEQAEKFMHLMVYGELVQSPQVQFAKALTDLLPENLNCCYLVNSGSEAIEGAMKLAKRATGRHEIIAFNNAYHGSTQGALSIIGSEYFRNSFRPLLPSIKHLNFGELSDLNEINSQTACVIVEPIQGEAGALVPSIEYLKTLSEKCKQEGALLIFDEIQTGFRRTGPLMAFMDSGVVPDVLVLAKAMGGGMPIGAFISSNEILNSFTGNPVLGHITTFGGHPVSCAAALASLKIVAAITEASVMQKSELFRKLLVHSQIKNISGKGLLLAIEFENEELNKKIIDACIKNGVFTDWFLFAPHKMRIAPPLIIETHEIIMACEIILKSIDEVTGVK